MAESKRRVEIIRESDVFKKAIFRIKEGRLRHSRFTGGMSEEITRLSLERGDSVAVLVHDPQREILVFTEQFRYPTFDPEGRRGGDGWLLETPAGMIDPDEQSLEAIKREVHEEIGYEVDEVRPIGKFFLSPGGSSERIVMYYAQIHADQQTSAGGGVLEEGEDIRVIELPVSEALAMLRDGTLADAKTIIGVQWLLLNVLNA
jgi:ADP-ribose pyrophosphatase